MTKLALLLFVSLAASAFDIPALTGRVVDLSGTLGASEVAQVTEALAALEAQRGAQGAVLLPKSLEGSDIESYALAVVEKWKLGHKGKDDGFLIVISPSDRRGRIEVGYGLEGEITDAFAKRLLSDVGTPYFKTGNYGGGLKAIVSAISDKLGGVDSLPPPQNRRVVSKMIHYRDFFFVLIFLLIAFFQAIFGRRRRSGFRSGGGGYWGGGGGFGGGGGWSGGGGGGFSGGGGGFGGGGSSSSW